MRRRHEERGCRDAAVDGLVIPEYHRPSLDDVADLLRDLVAYDALEVGRDWWNPDPTTLGVEAIREIR